MSGNEPDNRRVLRFIPALLSLQESAINTVVTNIGSYRELITKKISPPMRKTLYDRAMERIDEIGGDKVWAALPYLDQHKLAETISTRDFARMFRLESMAGKHSKPGATMEEFLQYLVDFVPNLRKLEIQDPGKVVESMEWYKKARLETRASDLLLKLENLTQVILNDVSIQFLGFVSVCRDSQNLQWIEAEYISIDEQQKKVMKNHLDTLDSKFDYQDYNGRMFPNKIVITFRKTNNVMPCKKANALLSDEFLNRIPSRFTHLQVSSMRDPEHERNYLVRILRREADTLKTLVLEYIWREFNITFKDIFEHCNELENLNLYESFIAENYSIASFGQLKIFKWENTYRDSLIRLGTILSAPLLQEVYISSIHIELVDKESLFSQIKNRTILTNLTKIQIKYIVKLEEDAPDREELIELDSVLTSSLRGAEVSIIIQIE